MMFYLYPQTAAALLRLSRARNSVRTLRSLSNAALKRGDFQAMYQLDRAVNSECARVGEIAGYLQAGIYAKK